ncbi:AAA family ATPase [Acinetobacter pecorum]|uniref:AAA family ATPase n=1 Tax=Acinetobacter pecorum TaxID=2762215 RepID=A0ABR8VUI7_9GAMM|nr:AAA family ATPase [Acinetobacter pecorum]MBD8008046.1 AAA family ATPase [Acinetobacter pecorum]
MSNIKKFGLFHDFKWNDTVRDQGNNILKFSKMNIIYARNYSGKTTLSRLIQCIEAKQKNPFYQNAECDFYFQDTQFSLDNLAQSSKKIKVYNVDFVKKNLDWQNDINGNIKPFSVVGEVNIDIEQQLTFFEKYLEKESQGIHTFEFYIEQAAEELKQENLKFTALERQIRASLAEYAVYMKSNTQYFNVPITFRQDQLEQKVREILNLQYVPFVGEIKNTKEIKVKEVIKDIIDVKFKKEFNLEKVKNDAINLLSKEVKPSIILERINTPIVEDWVLEGIHIHKKNHIENCSFCGSKLEKTTLEDLDAYFNKEVLEFQKEIQNLILHVENYMNELKALFKGLPDSSLFYSDLSIIYKDELSKFKGDITESGLWLKDLRDRLDHKLKNLFISIDSNVSEAPKKLIFINLEKIIEDHNLRSSQFNESIEAEKNSLTLQAFFEYIVKNEYDSNLKQLNLHSKKIDEALKKEREIDERKNAFSAAIDELRKKKVSEVSGIRIVNDYLEHFFAINHLRLIDYDNGSSFKVERSGELAHHLSEGECSLISFCYFMAKLKELENLKETIIWIDDPISSLDSNHIFYIFSLIENELAKPIIIPNKPKEYKYKQLFISTHNLDFLKYLHRISQPIIKKDQIVQACNHAPQCTKKVDSNECLYFILERSIDKSLLKPMPKYMKNFSTEYNYLFSKILMVATIPLSDLNEDYVYSFGNNLRKFLEAHLYFKYPTNKISDEDKLLKFISDPKITTICQRISNEMSHLQECFDRGISVLDIPECQKLAKAVLEILKASDPDQYDALFKSVT